jgi:hypothetical protein
MFMFLLHSGITSGSFFSLHTTAHAHKKQFQEESDSELRFEKVKRDARLNDMYTYETSNFCFCFC